MQKYKKELTPVYYNSSAIKELRFSFSPGKLCFRMHWHDRIELIRVRRGEMYVSYGAGTEKVHAEELVFLPPKTPHSGYTTDSEVEYDVLMFDIRTFYNESKLCRLYLPAIFDGRAKFRLVNTNPETVSCFDHVMKNSREETLESIADIYRLIFLLYNENLIEFSKSSGRSGVILEIIKYMEDNYARDMSVISISGHFGYTSAHLCRKFKEATGLTPMKYLQIYRLEEANRMLSSSALSISEIAGQCGFNDPNYFTRCYKAHFGHLPSSARQVTK